MFINQFILLTVCKSKKKTKVKMMLLFLYKKTGHCINLFIIIIIMQSFLNTTSPILSEDRQYILAPSDVESVSTKSHLSEIRNIGIITSIIEYYE